LKSEIGIPACSSTTPPEEQAGMPISHPTFASSVGNQVARWKNLPDEAGLRLFALVGDLNCR
jgi:hypothetical protein